MAHWVLQSNLWDETGWQELRKSVDRLGLPSTEVKVIPFAHEIVSADPDDDSDPVQHVRSPVVCVGSTALVKAARKRNWEPGAWYNEDTLRFDVQREYYREHLLNHEAVVCPFSDVPHRWDPFFIRPNEDTKSFAGEITSWDDYITWRDQVRTVGETWGKTIKMDDLVVVAAPKVITQEHRLCVVDGVVVTGSRYKVGNKVIYTPEIDTPVLKLADEIIRRFCPVDAFALDVAMTPEGMPKVLEVNCINSAGLYAADTMKLVHALDELANDKTHR